MFIDTQVALELITRWLLVLLWMSLPIVYSSERVSNKTRDQRVFNCLLIDKFGGGFFPGQVYTVPIFRCRCVSLFTHPLRCVVSLLSSFVFLLVFIFVTAIMLDTLFCQNQNVKFLYGVTRARRTRLSDASCSFHVINDSFIWTDFTKILKWRHQIFNGDEHSKFAWVLPCTRKP